MKEKVKSTPKQLVRRGLDDGTERLRSQLRDTAQRGQTDDYGGDRIEDTAVNGVRRAERGAERGIEALLKKKKNGRDRMPQEEPRSTAEPPAPQESPTDPPLQDPPRIKTREVVTAREGGPAPYDGGGVRPTPAAGSERQRIKIRESVVHDAPVSERPAEQTGSVRHQIKTRETVTPSDHTAATVPSSGENPSARLSIKTKDAYIQNQPVATSEPPPQAFTQDQRGFVQERGRTAAIKQAEIRRTGNGPVPQVQGGGNAASPAPARRGYASARPVHRPVSPADPDIQPVRESGKAIVKTGRPVRKAPERTARHAIKTAERSSRKKIKTAQQTAKTAERMAKTAEQTARATQKTAQATVKATQRAVQTARAAAQTAAAGTRAVVRNAGTTLKTAFSASQGLAALVAAGGCTVGVVVVVMCLAGVLAASPFGLFFSGGSGTPISQAVSQLDGEFTTQIEQLQVNNPHDTLDLVYVGGGAAIPSWPDVLSVYAVRVSADMTTGGAVILTSTDLAMLRETFWAMHEVTYRLENVSHTETTAVDGRTVEVTITETVLHITVTARDRWQMADRYRFNAAQREQLAELAKPEYQALFLNIL